MCTRMDRRTLLILLVLMSFVISEGFVSAALGRRQNRLGRLDHQLGRLVSESACERKDPGSNPAADMVDAARNTAWDLGKQPNNYRSNYPTQEWARRAMYQECVQYGVSRREYPDVVCTTKYFPCFVKSDELRHNPDSRPRGPDGGHYQRPGVAGPVTPHHHSQQKSGRNPLQVVHENLPQA
ncbi:hypothetical protein FHG87_008587 [Trinorchestia longiramus]|nr:hypothetical protein FHG87_008587 [Trinorchestia longiramus]